MDLKLLAVNYGLLFQVSGYHLFALWYGGILMFICRSWWGCGDGCASLPVPICARSYNLKFEKNKREEQKREAQLVTLIVSGYQPFDMYVHK